MSYGSVAWTLLTHRPRHPEDPGYRRWWWPAVNVWDVVTWLVFWGPRRVLLEYYTRFRFWLGGQGSEWRCPVPDDLVTCCAGRGRAMGVVRSVSIPERTAVVHLLDDTVVNASWECIDVEVDGTADYEHG